MANNGLISKPIFTMIILTPTVSPHFVNASERNQKMYRVPVLKINFGACLERREMITNAFRREYFRTCVDPRDGGSGKVVGNLRYPPR